MVAGGWMDTADDPNQINPITPVPAARFLPAAWPLLLVLSEEGLRRRRRCGVASSLLVRRRLARVVGLPSRP